MATAILDSDDPCPSDPPFVFCVLLSARLSGNRMLENLARDWLAQSGIRVTFDKRYPRLERGTAR